MAGVGGFGLVDKIIEAVTRRFLTDGIPPDYYTTMTYGSWQSVYCPSPPSFHAGHARTAQRGLFCFGCTLATAIDTRSTE